MAYFYSRPHLETSVRTAFAERELRDTPKDRLLSRLVRDYGPSASVIASFDHWISVVLPQQVAHKSLCAQNAVYSFDNVRVLKPMHDGAPLFPYQARKFGLTYHGELVVDVRVDPHPTVGEEVAKNIRRYERNRSLGKIMIMVGSVACHLRGLSPEEKRMVLEDSSDPGGYFIVRGGERMVMNEDWSAFSQAISKRKDDGLTTRITSNHVNGQEVIIAKQDSRIPEKETTAVNIALSAVGTKGSDVVTPEYPVFSLFDVLLQVTMPERFRYEGATSDSPMSADRLAKRADIVAYSQELINRFIPPEHRDRINHFLSASRAVYASIERPIHNLVLTRSGGSIAKVATDALQAAAKKSAARLVLARAHATRDADLPRSAETRKELEEAALTAAAAASAAHRATEDPRYEVCSEAIVETFFSEIFQNVPMKDKPLHLAWLAAHHCLVQTGVREPDDMDSWANRRIKQPVDWMIQIINGNLSKITLDARYYIPDNSNMLTDAFISHFSMGGGAGAAAGAMRAQVHVVRRDTQIALITQLGRLTPRAQRKTKQANIREIQPTHPGFCCPAETPTGEACGLTKNLACTTSIAHRRDRIRYINDLVMPALKEAYGDAHNEYHVHLRPNAVAVDGQIVGWCYGETFVRTLRPRTKTDLNYYDVTVIFNREDRVVESYTSGTRPVRPLFVVAGLGRPDPDGCVADLTDGRPPLIIDQLGPGAYDLPIPELIQAGAIEFVSPAEQQYYYLVQYPEETGAEIRRRCEEVASLPTPEMRAAKAASYLDMFSEIDPVALLGVAVGLMPSPDTCQGARATFQASMITQSIGLYHDAYYARDDTFKRTESTRPTYETRIAEPMGLNRSPTGRMFTVAILGLVNDQEDGIIVNRRAFANIHMTKYSTHKILVRMPLPEVADALARGVTMSEKKATFETIERPQEARMASAGMPAFEKYRCLDETGLPRLGAYISKGQCILGRTRTVVTRDGSSAVTNASVYAGVGEDGVVDRVSVVQGKGEREDENQPTLIVRIKIRQVRPVIPGDKMASRYSQKGTIAAARSNVPAIPLGAAPGTPYVPGADPGLGTIKEFSTLPHVASGPNRGLVPDLVINPACMPSRMTIGKLFEGVASKLALYTGDRFDATAFRPFTIDDINAISRGLEAHGLDGGGYEEMEHDDGRPFIGGEKVFLFSCYYQQLRHTVLDKIQFRSDGPSVSQITHQPLAGRSKEGGLRQGEMEKAALCSWGAAELIRERFMRASDLYKCEACATCGNLAATPSRVNGSMLRECRVCPPGQSRVVTVETPFISLLISRMISCFGINSPLVGLRPPHRPPDV